MIRVSSAATGPEEAEAFARALELGYYGHAGLVVELEERIASYLGASDVVCVGNGTAALHVALAATGVGPGDEVLIPTLTFVACFQMVLATGATPVACDIDPESLLLDLDDAKSRLSPATRVVMPVLYGGNPFGLDAVYSFAAEHGLTVVEDAAHGFGSTYQGRKVGATSELACFSFDSIKNITCGEGGAVVTSRPELAAAMRRMRFLGMERPAHSTHARERGWMFEVSTPGWRYHMSNLNGAVGLAQMAKLDGFIARRREISRRYDEAFDGLDGVRTLPIDYDDAAPHIYVIRVMGGRRDAMMQFLKDREIETGINYVPNHLHPLFRRDGATFPAADRAITEILTLPLHCRLSDTDVATVIAGVKEFLASP